MKKIFLIVLTVILAAVLAGLLWNDHRQEQEYASRVAQMEAEIRPYSIEYNQLEKELASLESSDSLRINGAAAVTLLFTGAGEEIATEVWPRLQSYGYPGMVVLTAEEFPGEEGCMSAEQFTALMEDGWSWCLGWPGEESDPAGALEELAARAEEAGLGTTAYVWFSEDGSDRYEDWLEENGYLAITDTVSWRADDRISRFNQAVSSGGNLVYHIPFGQTEGKTVSEELAYLDSMLEWVDAYCQSGTAKLLTAADAAAYREEMAAGQEEALAAWSAEKEELEQQIAELEERMEQIELSYFGE